MRKPRVTVGIPVFNASATIDRCLTSLLSQTGPTAEFLFIDDGSTDDSAERIARVGDPRVRLVSNGANLGLASTRNRILEEARGEFLAWLDADDAALPDRLAMQTAALEADPRRVAVASWARVHGQRGTRGRLARPSVSGRRLAASQLFWNVLQTSSVMMRLSVPRRSGLLFAETLAPSEDYDFWSRLVDYGLIDVIQRCLVNRWELPTGASVRGSVRQESAAREIRERLVEALVPGADQQQLCAHRWISEGLPEHWSVGDVDTCSAWLETLAHVAPLNRPYGDGDLRAVAGACLLRLANTVARRQPTLAIHILNCSSLRTQAAGWALRRSVDRLRIPESSLF